MHAPSSADALYTQRQLGLKGRLRWFVEAAWHVVEPSTPFVHGRHIDLVCEHLEALHARELSRLAICMPPGHMKSTLCCVMYNVWKWLREPQHRFLFGSYDIALPLRDAGKVINLIQSEWFRHRWGDRVRIVSLKNTGQEQKDPAVRRFYTRDGGMRFSTAPGAGGTGWHAHTRIVDDPISPKEAFSEKALADRVEWVTGTLGSRKADPKDDTMLIVMQRLHELDPAGVAVRDLGYESLVLPWEYNARVSHGTKVGADWRAEQGELLWPERHDAKTTAQFKRDLKTARNVAAQMQQDPVPDDGIIFQREWFQTLKVLPPDVLKWIDSWDLTFDDEGADPDYVAGQVWALTRTQAILVHRVHARMNFPASIRAMLDVRIKHPQIQNTLVEKRANGAAAIRSLEKRIRGIVPVDTEGKSKVVRAHGITHLFEARNVYVLDACPGADEWQASLKKFPAAAHDDDVDATIYALRHWEDNFSTLEAALAALADAKVDIVKLLAG